MKPYSLLFCCFWACSFFISFSCTRPKDDQTPTLSIDPANGLLDDAVGYSISFTVSSNIKWNLSVFPDSANNWLQLDKTSGDNTTDVKLTVTGKDNSGGNEVLIIASAADGSQISNDTFAVSQFPLHGAWKQRGKWTYDNQYSIYGLTFAHNNSIYFGLGEQRFANDPVIGQNTIYKLDTVNYTWSPAFTLPSGMLSRYYPFVFTLNNKVYIGGGKRPPYGGTEDMWELDPANGAWRKMATPPAINQKYSAFSAGGVGYVILHAAWYNSGQELANSIYSFTLNSPTDTGTWKLDRNINLTTKYVSTFTLKDVGYFGGGMDYFRLNPQTDFYSYSPGSGLTNVNPLPAATYYEPKAPDPDYMFRAAAFTSGDKGYVLCQGKILCEFTPATNTWKIISTIPANFPFASAIGNRIFAWNKYGNVIEYVP